MERHKGDDLSLQRVLAKIHFNLLLLKWWYNSVFPILLVLQKVDVNQMHLFNTFRKKSWLFIPYFSWNISLLYVCMCLLLCEEKGKKNLKIWANLPLIFKTFQKVLMCLDHILVLIHDPV